MPDLERGFTQFSYLISLQRTYVRQSTLLVTESQHFFSSSLFSEQNVEGKRWTRRCAEEKGNEKLENRKVVRRICAVHAGTVDGN
jgi:hypothetical protein